MMPELLFLYGIRHIKSGELMPQAKARRGYSYWNPDNPDLKFGNATNRPRFFDSERSAKCSIIQWAKGVQVNEYEFGYYGQEVIRTITKSDGRRKEDLEVVKFRIEEVND